VAWLSSYYSRRPAEISAASSCREYPGHDEWTEVFDLKTDPYETRNLANDPAFADLRKRLEAEYAKQSAAIAFRIPDFADVPSANPAARPRKKANKAK